MMLFPNPTFDPTYTPPVPSRRALVFHRRMPQYRPTPLRSLETLARVLGIGKLLVKDESDRLGLPAFKILGASWATYRALCNRYPGLDDGWAGVDELARRLRTLEPPALYAATDGNHGRAVARVAALLGLRARIYMPEGSAAARIAAIESERATVEIVPGTYNAAVAKAAHDAEAQRGLLIQDNGWEGYEEIPRYVVEGYSTLLWEIDDALDQRNELRPTHVFVQIGVGSFAEAVVRHFARKTPRPLIVGVEPDTAACALESVRASRIVHVPGPHRSIMVGMNCDSPSTVSFPILQKGVPRFCSISDEHAVNAMRLLAEQGIVSGETGAAGLGALLYALETNTSQESLGLNSESRVLIFSTEGATNPELYRRLVQPPSD